MITTLLFRRTVSLVTCHRTFTRRCRAFVPVFQANFDGRQWFSSKENDEDWQSRTASPKVGTTNEEDWQSQAAPSQVGTWKREASPQADTGRKTLTRVKLSKGSVHWGKVEKILTFGALVRINDNNDNDDDTGTLERRARVGLVHISQISHDFVRSVSDMLHVGMPCQVMVLEDRRRHLELSMKQVKPTPADTGRKTLTRVKLSKGSVHWGVVEKIQTIGALVRINDNNDNDDDTGTLERRDGARVGLVHISQISHDFVHSVSDVLHVGMPCQVMVLEDRGRELELSMKQVKPTLPDNFNPVKVVVFNLPYEMTEDGVKQLFEQYGSVLEVSLTPSHPATRDGLFSDEELREYAFVTFETRKEADACVRNLREVSLEIGSETYRYRVKVKIARNQNFKEKLQQELDEEHELKQRARKLPRSLRRRADNVIRDIIPYYEG